MLQVLHKTAQLCIADNYRSWRQVDRSVRR